MKKLEKLIAVLKKKKLSIAAAESCTGGYVSYLLTKIPGSSEVFKGGIVSYSLETKNKFFKIPLPILEKSQGVSKTIALILAEKVKNIFNSDIGVSVVGFAGPEAKPITKIGTVFIGVSDKNGSQVKKLVLKGNRDKIRKSAGNLLIELIQTHLMRLY